MNFPMQIEKTQLTRKKLYHMDNLFRFNWILFFRNNQNNYFGIQSLLLVNLLMFSEEKFSGLIMFLFLIRKQRTCRYLVTSLL